MGDVFSPQERSAIMSLVRSRGNKNTELAMIALFRKYAITGWRRRARVFGHPDFVFPKSRVAVFVDGCFWHGCPQHGTMPVDNAAFWKCKLERNQHRDRFVNKTLRQRGWLVVRIWQHDLKRASERRCMSRLQRLLKRS